MPKDQPEAVERNFKKPTPSFVMAKAAAMEMLKENSDLVEQAAELEASFVCGIDGTPARMKVTLKIEIMT